MSLEICPHCQDFTQQTLMTDIQGKHSYASGVESKMNISICHACGNSVEHEQITMKSFDEPIQLENKYNSIAIAA
jgi:hypothetical protein